MLLRKYQRGVTDFGSGLSSSTNFASTTGSDFSVTENEELSCPQGYVYDRVKKICVSISQSANFNDRKGRVDELWEDVPDFEIKELKNLKYLKGLPSIGVSVLQTDYVETPESYRGQHFDHINIYPKPNYKLIIDKTKPEGYFDKVNNILYTQTADSPHSKKFNEWNKLIELQEENINRVKTSKNVKFSDNISEAYNDTDVGDKYKDPLYYNNKIKTNQEYINKICPQCAASHGSSYVTDNDYLIETRNKKYGRLTDETTPFVLTSTTTTPTKAAYRKENYITYTPIEGTDYLLMKQDYRKGKEPYQTWGDKGWVDNPKSKLIYHLDASGNEIASPKNALSETQYKEYLKAGLIKPTKNLAVTNQRKGGILLIKYM